jgi:hypothetical protein
MSDRTTSKQIMDTIAASIRETDHERAIALMEAAQAAIEGLEDHVAEATRALSDERAKWEGERTGTAHRQLLVVEELRRERDDMGACLAAAYKELDKAGSYAENVAAKLWPESPPDEYFDAFKSVNCTFDPMVERLTFSGDYGNWLACYLEMRRAALQRNEIGVTVACAHDWVKPYLTDDRPETCQKCGLWRFIPAQKATKRPATGVSRAPLTTALLNEHFLTLGAVLTEEQVRAWTRRDEALVDLCRVLEERCNELVAERPAQVRSDDAQDAARYRFLRNPSEALQRVGRQNLVIGNFEADLDAAIDDAMQRNEEGRS